MRYMPQLMFQLLKNPVDHNQNHLCKIDEFYCSGFLTLRVMLIKPFNQFIMTNMLLRSILWLCILAVIVILFGKQLIAFINRDVVPY